MDDRPMGFKKFDCLMRKLIKVRPNELNKIRILCPACGRAKIVDRHETDPPTAVVCETKCPECVGSDFSIVYYYDAAGNDVSMGAG